MKKKILLGLALVVGGYLALVLLHWLYLELGGRSYAGEGMLYRSVAYEAKMAPSMMVEMPTVRNFATASYVQGAQAAIEQKYEKIADLNSVSQHFAEDETAARAVVGRHNALLQAETSHSSEGLRSCFFTIGVPPSDFDGIASDLKHIGVSTGFDITKADKTDEYLRLRAQRTTLEKSRDAFVAMKVQGGKIEELIRLEKEIFELEGKIQGLGVQLGQFDKANDLCTVRFTLHEQHEAAPPRVDHLGYLVRSFEWAGTVSLTLLTVIFVGLLGIILILVILEKAKLMKPEA